MATPCAAHADAFDPSHWPATLGEPLSAVLARWGEAATFGADCGSWRGPSVDRTFDWQGRELRVMALLHGDRVTALRFERGGARSGREGGDDRDGAQRSEDLAQCQGQLEDFAREWAGQRLSAGSVSVVYDGPTLRTVRPASQDGRLVGSFEADYRQSRAECRIALMRTAE